MWLQSGLTGHSSCSPPYVVSIKFWLVNDCLFFAEHMESAVYSLSLYSHWLTPVTDVGTVIVPYCWSASPRTATHWVVFSKRLQFAILFEDYCKSRPFYSHSREVGVGGGGVGDKKIDTWLSHELNLILWRICAQDVQWLSRLSAGIVHYFLSSLSSYIAF